MGITAKKQSTPWQGKGGSLGEILGISFQQLKYKMPQTLLPKSFLIFQN